MLKGASLGKEVCVKVVNKIGVLADISKILTDHRINIEAVKGYAKEDQEAEIVVLTADNRAAVEALIKKGYRNTKEREVVVVELENKPGALMHITEKLAEKEIDIKYIYGTTCKCKENCPARIVLSTSDNAKALLAFKK